MHKPDTAAFAQWLGVRLLDPKLVLAAAASTVVSDSTRLLAIASGASAHIVVFSLGEWDVSSLPIFLSYLPVFLEVSLGFCTPYEQLHMPLSEIARFGGVRMLGLCPTMFVLPQIPASAA